MKRKVTLSVREDLVEFAKNNNINMSRLLEEALLNLYFQKSLFLGPGPGFEPGPGDPQSPVLTRLHHPGHSIVCSWIRFIKFSPKSREEGG